MDNLTMTYNEQLVEWIFFGTVACGGNGVFQFEAGPAQWLASS